MIDHTKVLYNWVRANGTITPFAALRFLETAAYRRELLVDLRPYDSVAIHWDLAIVRVKQQLREDIAREREAS
jgi:hypothetical protein